MGIVEENLKERYIRSKVRAEHRIPIHLIVDTIQVNTSRYKKVEEVTGVKWFIIAVIHSLESGCNFNKHLHNGDPLSSRTIHIPSGRPRVGRPPFTWVESAIDALTGRTGLLEDGLGEILDALEKYNGLGYRNGAGRSTTPPMTSPYLWSQTDQYVKGKYTYDGRFDPNVVSQQAGAVAILKMLEERVGPLFEETRTQAPEPEELPESPEERVGWFEVHLLEGKGRSHDVGIVAKEAGSDTSVAIGRFIAQPEMQNGFLNQFPKANNVVVAPRDKPWPTEVQNETPQPGFTRKKLLTIAMVEAGKSISWRGNGKARKYTKKFEPVFGESRFAWCAAFVTWCCEQAGLEMPVNVPGSPGGYTFALVEAWQQWAIREGFWHTDLDKMEPGDIVCFDWDGAEQSDNDWEDHIGVFSHMENSLFVCAEGNVSDETKLKSRKAYNIQGYLRIPAGYSFS